MHEALQQQLQQMLDEAVASGASRGTQVAVYYGGACAASAFAGTLDAQGSQPVREDSLFPVFSVTKGVAAVLIHRMVYDGRLAYDAPIARYWPAFGQSGKAHITLRHALCHTAGLACLPNDLPRETLDDWDAMCRYMETMAPQYEAGSSIAYHALTYGWLLGETAAQADGRPFDQIFREEIAAPLGLKAMRMRVDADEDDRVAWLTEAAPPKPVDGPLASIPACATPLGAYRNIPASRRTCQPAASGMMSAESLARFYAALLPGGVDGITLLPQPVLDLAAAETKGPDNPDHRSMGFTVSSESPIYGVEGFCVGHGGYGGARGFVNRTHGFAFGFTHNHFSPEGDALELRLVQAVEAALVRG